MANYIKILIRRDTTANWTATNPVLALGEIAADLTKHGLKVGDGVTAWNNLAWCTPEMVNDLITGGTDRVLTAEQGKKLREMVETKADSTTVNNLTQEISNLNETIVNIEAKADIFGMGYTIDSFNTSGKPTHIVFDDGVTATLTWTGNQLNQITASTGEVMTMKYNVNGTVIGREITKAG
mgnify:CR=1 FL=1